MNFVAIDVETANADIGSICQIGVAVFTNGQLANEWCVLVDPEDYFDGVNISIHGIEPHMVEGQPTFPQIASRLRSELENTITVCHTHFDRIAIGRAFSKHGLSPIATQWLDSARVVRRTWPEFAWKGYGLANVCRKIGYEFKHHDALEDAKAAGAATWLLHHLGNRFQCVVYVDDVVTGFITLLTSPWTSAVRCAARAAAMARSGAATSGLRSAV